MLCCKTLYIVGMIVTHEVGIRLESNHVTRRVNGIAPPSCLNLVRTCLCRRRFESDAALYREALSGGLQFSGLAKVGLSPFLAFLLLSVYFLELELPWLGSTILSIMLITVMKRFEEVLNIMVLIIVFV